MTLAKWLYKFQRPSLMIIYSPVDSDKVEISSVAFQTSFASTSVFLVIFRVHFLFQQSYFYHPYTFLHFPMPSCFPKTAQLRVEYDAGVSRCELRNAELG
jgi:hypothetical protein